MVKKFLKEWKFTFRLNSKKKLGDKFLLDSNRCIRSIELEYNKYKEKLEQAHQILKEYEKIENTWQKVLKNREEIKLKIQKSNRQTALDEFCALLDDLIQHKNYNEEEVENLKDMFFKNKDEINKVISKDSELKAQIKKKLTGYGLKFRASNNNDSYEKTIAYVISEFT